MATATEMTFERRIGSEKRAIMIRFALCAATTLLLTFAALADEAAVRGEAVVEQWCRLCHLRADDPPDSVMAPRFDDIVRREGRDEAYFMQFLKEDHFPMTTFRLFDSEKADVVAWLMDLQKEQTRK